jgi:hypothetical protein
MGKKEIGVSAGIRVILWVDDSVDCRGASPQEALLAAETRLRFGGRSKDDLALISRWVELMRSKIDADEFDRGVDKAAEPELGAARRLLRQYPYAFPVAAKIILEREREKRTPK